MRRISQSRNPGNTKPDLARFTASFFSPLPSLSVSTLSHLFFFFSRGPLCSPPTAFIFFSLICNMATPEENYNENENGLASAADELEEPEQKNKLENNSGTTGSEKRWPGWPGESVFRLLVPVQKVGSIIGRKGEFIKKMCEESKARIKILDGPPGTQERAVMVSAKEEPDSSNPPAVDGLLRVHKRIVDGLDGDLSNLPPVASGPVTSRLLVAATQAGSLIGKQGSTIKSIQEASNCIIRVLGPDDLPVFALQDDRIVEIQGEPTGVHKAIELTASHLRKFLVDRGVIGLIEMQMQRPNPQVEHNMPPHPSWGPPPQGFPQNASSGPAFGLNPQFVMPPRQHENYYPPADLPPTFPPVDKPPHQGQSMYGRDAPMGVHSTTNMQSQSIINQVTQNMQIPLSYADAVIGTAGANISYIRRASGASITIQETRGVPGEMTVEINGTASQVQAAQQLIQNFMAEAAGSLANPASAPTDNSYQAHSSVYSSPPANTGHANQAQGGYGSGYGTNYGVSYGY